MYQTGVSQRFSARHALRGDFGAESVEHSHPYEVEWVCSMADLDENGFSVDISLLERGIHEVLAAIDNRFLNDLPFFEHQQSSLENTCRFLHNQLSAFLTSQKVSTTGPMIVKIWESATAWASITRPQAKVDTV